jgi:hypothetical protein
MKNLRFILTTLAIVVALGGAIASTQLTSNIYYEYMDLEEDLCFPHEVEFACQLTPTNEPCRVNVSAPILREHEEPETVCGSTLWKTP